MSQISRLAETVAEGSFTSFSGADITAVIGNKAIGALQAISFSVTREKAPIYTMGSAEPIAFARNKRAIAGSMIFLNFDRDAFLSHMKETFNSKFYGSVKDVRYDKDNIEDIATLFQTGGDQIIDSNDFTAITEGRGPGYEKREMEVWYADQILPFDVNISAANEYGEIAKISIIGVEILNQGSGISIDDLVMEQQYTYIARGITPLKNLLRPNR